MIVQKIKGKVLDEKGQSIPSALVFLSTKDGTLVQEFRTRADIDGNYELPFLVKTPTLMGIPMTLPLAQYVTVKMLSFPTRTVQIKQDSDLNSFDIVMKIRSQDVAEVVVSGKDKLECYKKGGTWDSKTKTCVMPKTVMPKTVKPKTVKPKTWWQKNWWWLIGGLALTATTVTIIVVKQNQKK